MPEPGGWGLTREPFTLCADPEMLYLGAGHRDALARLLYAVRTHKGGALLVSEDAGDGKTSLLRRLLLDLAVPGAPPVLSAFIEYPTLTPTQMLRAIATGLGAPKALRDKATAVASLREHLLAHRATGGVAVVVVDEGQLLADRTAVLQELRILLNLSTPEGFLLTFLLSGQKPLMAAVKAIPELWQRLPVRIFLDHLNARETREMIAHRLRMAGGGKPVFTDAGAAKLHDLARGIPRAICALADLAMVVASSRRLPTVDAPEVVEAHRDMERGAAADGFHYFHAARSQRTAPPRPADAP